jgi:hypothetical protein
MWSTGAFELVDSELISFTVSNYRLRFLAILAHTLHELHADQYASDGTGAGTSSKRPSRRAAASPG